MQRLYCDLFPIWKLQHCLYSCMANQTNHQVKIIQKINLKIKIKKWSELCWWRRTCEYYQPFLFAISWKQGPLILVLLFHCCLFKKKKQKKKHTPQTTSYGPYMFWTFHVNALGLFVIRPWPVSLPITSDHLLIFNYFKSTLIFFL